MPEINGVPGCADGLLRDALAAWGFAGYRCTDGGQVSQLVTAHRYLPDIWSSIGATAAALSDVSDGSEYAQVRSTMVGGRPDRVETTRDQCCVCLCVWVALA